MDIGRNAVTIWGADGNEIKGVADSISFDVGEVERSEYVGIETGELSFSAEVVDVDNEALSALFGLSEEFNAQGVAFKTYEEWLAWAERFRHLARKGKYRKTTYRTIRRDCAKRNQK